jgi:methylase of polypeptide subunit release factors
MKYINGGDGWYRTNGKNRYTVIDLPELDGGGRWWASEFPRILAPVFPGRVFEKCFDWCSGPGYCGFEVLDYGMCKQLVLGDIHPLAIEYANKTIDYPDNNCKDIVTAYNIGRIDQLPTSEKFDLVIGNPPHTSGVNLELDADQTRILSDVGWKSHKEFFQNIGNYLTDDGVILLCENASPGAGPKHIFEPMVKSNGLKITHELIPEDFDIIMKPYYYLVIEKN